MPQKQRNTEADTLSNSRPLCQGKILLYIFATNFFMKRSEFLQTSAAIVGGSLLPNITIAEQSNKKNKIRFAHLTDIHVKPSLVPETGMAKAFQHAQSLKPNVDFIIDGTDSIM